MSKFFFINFFSIFPLLTVTWDLTKFLTSSSDTLPALCVPGISDTLAPSSLANFLTFGLANLFTFTGVLSKSGIFFFFIISLLITIVFLLSGFF